MGMLSARSDQVGTRSGLVHHPGPVSLRQIMTFRLGVLAFSCAVFLVGYVLVSTHFSPAPHASSPTGVAGSTTDAARLIERFDCWSGPAPADMEGRLPGHVIVTRIGHHHAFRGGEAWVGKALEQVFNGVDNNLRVHAFCR